MVEEFEKDESLGTARLASVKLTPLETIRKEIFSALLTLEQRCRAADISEDEFIEAEFNLVAEFEEALREVPWRT